MPDPPVASASISSTGRGHSNAIPRAVVVTPGEPDAEQSAMTAMSSPRPGVQHDRDIPGCDLGCESGGLGVGDQKVHDELTGVIRYPNADQDRKSTRLTSRHQCASRMP